MNYECDRLSGWGELAVSAGTAIADSASSAYGVNQQYKAVTAQTESQERIAMGKLGVEREKLDLMKRQAEIAGKTNPEMVKLIVLTGAGLTVATLIYFGLKR